MILKNNRTYSSRELYFAIDKLCSRKTFFGGTGSPFEVSALTLSQPDTSMKYAQHVILGFWLTNEVKVFTLPSFAPTGDVVKVPQAPRSLLLFDFGLILSESMPHLLIGLIDGSVCVVLFQKGKFSEKSTFTLGDSVVSLAPCNVDGRPAVFASSTRSVLFFWNKDALSYSTILTKVRFLYSNFIKLYHTNIACRMYWRCQHFIPRHTLYLLLLLHTMGFLLEGF